MKNGENKPVKRGGGTDKGEIGRKYKTSMMPGGVRFMNIFKKKWLKSLMERTPAKGRKNIGGMKRVDGELVSPCAEKSSIFLGENFLKKGQMRKSRIKLINLPMVETQSTTTSQSDYSRGWRNSDQVGTQTEEGIRSERQKRSCKASDQMQK